MATTNDTHGKASHEEVIQEALRKFDARLREPMDDLSGVPNLHNAALKNAAKARRLIEASPAWCSPPFAQLDGLLGGTSVGLYWNLGDGTRGLEVIVGSDEIEYIHYHISRDQFRETRGYFNPDHDERIVLQNLLARVYGRTAEVAANTQAPEAARSRVAFTSLKELDQVVRIWRDAHSLTGSSASDLEISALRVHRMIKALPDWCPAPGVFVPQGWSVTLEWRPSDDSSFCVFVDPQSISYTWSCGGGPTPEHANGTVDCKRDLPITLAVLLAAAFRRPADATEVR